MEEPGEVALRPVVERPAAIPCLALRRWHSMGECVGNR